MLIDTNIVIAAEDHSSPQGHAHGAAASRFLALANELAITVCVSAGTASDISRAPAPRRETRAKQLERYYVLGHIPIDSEVAQRAKFPANPSPNDRADLEILCALTSGAVDYLVTQDKQLRARAERVEPIERVLSLAQANAWLEGLLTQPSSIPAIEIVSGYSIPLSASVFRSLRENYPQFDDWWKRKVARESRDVAVIGDSSDPEGIAVFKPEAEGPVGPALKICTFTTRSDQARSKLGEQLLKGCIDYARRNGHERVYVEVNPELYLLNWLVEFGFEIRPERRENGDRILLKRLAAPPDASPMTPLEHAIAYGPGSALVERAFVVPIQSHWHEILFPEVPNAQLRLITERERPCGNAIRKAYLSNSPTNKLTAGDLLVFLRTGDGPSVVTVSGVVEETRRSAEALEIIRFVGSGTVYSRAEIASLCDRRPVLATRFRLNRVLDVPVGSRELLNAGILKGAPQSITQLSEKGVLWARQLFA